MKPVDLYDTSRKNGHKALKKFGDYERNQALKYFFDAVAANQKILDLGCGEGSVSDWFQKLGYSVTAADFSSWAVALTKSRGIKDVALLDVEKPLPWADGYFQYVFWGDVLEHLFDPASVLKEIYRVLASGGKLVLSCPNVGYLGFRLKFLLRGSIRALELAGQLPWEQEHIRFFNTYDLSELLCKTGFRVTKIEGVNRLWHSRLLARLCPRLCGYIQVVEAIKA